MGVPKIRQVDVEARGLVGFGKRVCVPFDQRFERRPADVELPRHELAAGQFVSGSGRQCRGRLGRQGGPQRLLRVAETAQLALHHAEPDGAASPRFAIHVADEQLLEAALRLDEELPAALRVGVFQLPEVVVCPTQVEGLLDACLHQQVICARGEQLLFAGGQLLRHRRERRRGSLTEFLHRGQHTRQRPAVAALAERQLEFIQRAGCLRRQQHAREFHLGRCKPNAVRRRAAAGRGFERFDPRVVLVSGLLGEPRAFRARRGFACASCARLRQLVFLLGGLGRERGREDVHGDQRRGRQSWAGVPRTCVRGSDALPSGPRTQDRGRVSEARGQVRGTPASQRRTQRSARAARWPRTCVRGSDSRRDRKRRTEVHVRGASAGTAWVAGPAMLS